MPQAGVPLSATAVGGPPAPGRALRARPSATVLDLGAGVASAVYVDPAGSDSNPGTALAPFATPERARAAVQPHLAGMAGDVLIVLRGGRYQLDSTLRLAASDSGQNAGRVRYVAAKAQAPVLSGGVPLVGWRQESQGWLWSAPLPAVFAGQPQPTPREIYVNGVRASRVRGTWPAGGGTMARTSTGFSFSGGTNPIASWRNPQTIELVYRIQWMEQHLGVASMDSSTITMQDTGGAPWTASNTLYGPDLAPSGPPTFVDHAKELLSAGTSGQFWVDSPAARLYYVPRAGENLAAATVLAPALEALLSLEGCADVSFEGLTFAEGTWWGVNQTGLAEWGGNSYVTSNAMAAAGSGVSLPGCVRASACGSVRFADCTFARLGGAGLWLDSGCTDGAIADCSFCDLGAGGIAVDGNTPGSGSDAPYASATNVATIERSVVHDCNLEYAGGEGITVVGGAGTKIAHNHIYNQPYIGIDVRGTALVEYNRVHDVMQILPDGGAIYSYGRSGGILERRNWCHTHQISGSGGVLYLDNHSSNKTVLNNVVYHSAGDTQPTFFGNAPGSANHLRLNWSDAATGGFGVGFLDGATVALNRLVSGTVPAPASVTQAAGAPSSSSGVPPARCSAPRALVVLAVAPSSSSVTLGWSAPEAGTALFYEVWDQDADVLLGTTTGQSFVFADLAPGGQYVFAVRAVDASEGVSAPSAPLLLLAPEGTVARSSYGSGWE